MSGSLLLTCTHARTQVNARHDGTLTNVTVNINTQHSSSCDTAWNYGTSSQSSRDLMTQPHSFRVTQPLEYKTRFHPWHLYRGDFLHAIRLFNQIAKDPFALTSYTVPIFPFRSNKGRNVRTSDRNSSAFHSWGWGPFSTLGLHRRIDFLHLYQNRDSSDADWTTARLLPVRPITDAIKRFAPFVFCIVEIFSVHNKQYGCMGDQNTATSSAFYSCC